MFWSNVGLGYTVAPKEVLPLDCTGIDGISSVGQINMLMGMNLPTYSMVLTKDPNPDAVAGLAYIGGPVALVKWRIGSEKIMRHEAGHLFGALDCSDDQLDIMCRVDSEQVSYPVLNRMRLWLHQQGGE
jgi:hypothetical protein